MCSQTTQTKEKIVAILCADLHLQITPPAWRSAEPNWLDAMARPLDELAGLSTRYKAPILCAGDVVTNWNSPPELINWMLDHVPHMYSIYGQHDIPDHDRFGIKRSAYWTLVKAGIITNIQHGLPLRVEDLSLFGFPYGYSVTQLKMPKYIRQGICVALCHEYNWMKGHCYSGGGAIDREVHKNRYDLRGYDTVVYGDNHSGFLTRSHGATVFNCGSMMRRRSDQEKYQPTFGLLTEKGHVLIHNVDISKDRHLAERDQIDEADEAMIADVLGQLERLGDCGLKFSETCEALAQRMHASHDAIRMLRRALNA